MKGEELVHKKFRLSEGYHQEEFNKHKSSERREEIGKDEESLIHLVCNHIDDVIKFSTPFCYARLVLKTVHIYII